MIAKQSIYIGFDPREVAAFAVARRTVRRSCGPITVHGLILDDLRSEGLYHRPTGFRDGRLWDEISQAPMSTEFAISRFLVPHLAKTGWALFMDCDMMIRDGNVSMFGLFQKMENHADKAVMCVKHDHVPASDTKMDDQAQLRYARKNWSSFMLFNCDHPSNAKLTLDLINSVPGRDLHRFCWLDDDEIGELSPAWNYLVGYTDMPVEAVANVHFTEGMPDIDGHRDDVFADDWRRELIRWAR